jgi:two-component system response regulator DctR
MQPLIDATVFVVDDDAEVRDGMAWLQRSRRLSSYCFKAQKRYGPFSGPVTPSLNRNACCSMYAC